MTGKLKHGYRTRSQSTDDWLWCLHCERVHRVREWRAPERHVLLCPTPGCDGVAMEGERAGSWGWDGTLWREQFPDRPEPEQSGQYVPEYPVSTD